MGDVKRFDALTIGSLTTGIMLKERGFSDMHEAFEHVMGHPVWTHEMASKPLWESARDRVVAQHPEFPVEVTTTWQDLAEKLSRDYPDGIEIKRGDAERATDPISSLVEIIGSRS